MHGATRRGEILRQQDSHKELSDSGVSWLDLRLFWRRRRSSFSALSPYGEEGVLEVLSTEVWPCNFFQRIDNNGDTYHVAFVHRDAYSASAANNRSGLPEVSKEESPWGTTGYASFAQGWRNVFQFFMPNAYAFRN